MCCGRVRGQVGEEGREAKGGLGARAFPLFELATIHLNRILRTVSEIGWRVAGVRWKKGNRGNGEATAVILDK